MMKISETTMAIVAHSFCMPVTLLINFALFQYLLTMYYKRRRELRGGLLLVCAFLGFVTLVPFAYPDANSIGHLNDISETCSVLTFLLQITIIGRDINRKVRIAALKYMTYVSEFLVVFGLVVVIQNFLEVAFPHMYAIDGLDNIMEDVGLWFIFVFRFVILAMARGYRFVLTHKKLEITMYLLFVTHEYPFIALENATGVSWEAAQALWNRLTLALCVGMTIQEKMRSNASQHGTKVNTTHVSMGGPQLEVMPAASKSRSLVVKMSFRSKVRPAVKAAKAAKAVVVTPHR